MDNIKKLGKLFSEIVENNDAFNSSWKNIPLAKEAFALMTDELPLRVKGELTPYTRVVLLEEMLDCLPERDCARFIMKVREYQLTMFPLMQDSDFPEDMDIDHYEGPAEKFERFATRGMIEERMERTTDYLSMPMEEWCKKYYVHLKFDPVEQTQAWEDAVFEAEKRVASNLGDVEPHMGFCYEYWAEKRAVLASMGIEWSSPAAMNPRVMFD